MKEKTKKAKAESVYHEEGILKINVMTRSRFFFSLFLILFNVYNNYYKRGLDTYKKKKYFTFSYFILINLSINPDISVDSHHHMIF